MESILFNKLGPDEKIYGGKKNLKYKRARLGFLLKLGRTYQTDIEFVERIYRLMDNLTGEYFRRHWLACYKGCHYCCHLTFATSLEQRVIEKFLKLLSRDVRGPVLKELAKQRKKFLKLLEGEPNPENFPLIWREKRDAILNLTEKIICPFLDSNNCCIIHPVRPIDCRLLKSVKNCGKIQENASLPKIIFLFERIASDLIIEQEKINGGTIKILPLIGWKWKS